MSLDCDDEPLPFALERTYPRDFFGRKESMKECFRVKNSRTDGRRHSAHAKHPSTFPGYFFSGSQNLNRATVQRHRDANRCRDDFDCNYTSRLCIAPSRLTEGRYGLVACLYYSLDVKPC